MRRHLPSHVPNARGPVLRAGHHRSARAAAGARRRAVQRRAGGVPAQTNGGRAPRLAHVPAVAHAVPGGGEEHAAHAVVRQRVGLRDRAERAARQTALRVDEGGGGPRVLFFLFVVAVGGSHERVDAPHRGPPVVAAAAQDAFVRVHHEGVHRALVRGEHQGWRDVALGAAREQMVHVEDAERARAGSARQVSVRGRPHAHTEEDVRVHHAGLLEPLLERRRGVRRGVVRRPAVERRHHRAGGVRLR